MKELQKILLTNLKKESARRHTSLNFTQAIFRSFAPEYSVNDKLPSWNFSYYRTDAYRLGELNEKGNVRITQKKRGENGLEWMKADF